MAALADVLAIGANEGGGLRRGLTLFNFLTRVRPYPRHHSDSRLHRQRRFHRQPDDGALAAVEVTAVQVEGKSCLQPLWRAD